MQEKENWFKTWFDSPYYPILYKHRDHEEAMEFMDTLCNYLAIKEGSHVLDLCCGRGRHSVYLHKKGYSVTGLDLSKASIEEASLMKANGLAFFVHDMRDVFMPSTFEYVFNLFTSFGYFDEEAENEKVIAAVHQMLVPEGHFVLDFLNPRYVIERLVTYEEKVIEKIWFKIERRVQEDKIVKDIFINDHGRTYHFQEKVKALSYESFKEFFERNGFELEGVFGNYKLEKFDLHQSERMIFIAKKHP